ncbi:MAG: glycosyltransferase family 9 protein [Actinomycetota bacterium]|nr:glycosyltransferase family 9 protein [Actinomycetota bacterium]
MTDGTRTRTTLVARLDSDGDVLLSGPAVRAVAAGSDRVVLLAGPRGAAAARLLPGVDEVLVWHCPWIDADPRPVDPSDVAALVDRVRGVGPDRALVLTSFHQSPLPLALLLRLARVPWIGATSEDFPGALLDLRHRLPESGLHEAQRQLSLAEAAGFALPDGDAGGLALRDPLPDVRDVAGGGRYVVVHPGASVPARQPSAAWSARLVRALADAGHRVLVTGGPAERTLTAAVAASGGTDLGGATDLAGLAAVLAGADAVVVGNTGPAHLAAAVGTPVVSLFAPVVPADRWRPWRVPHVLFGDQSAPCALSRARSCPVEGHPCLDGVPVEEAVDAVARLASDPLSRSGRVREVSA